MSKRVRITIEVDSLFVRMLAANIELSGLRERDKLSPDQVLALAACTEMCGALEHEVDALIPGEWRDNLRVVHEERRVIETGAP